MAIYYSGSAGGFFDANLFDPETFVFPADAVEVTSERHQQLLAEQGTGKRIVAGEDGHPMTVEPEPEPQLPLSKIKAMLKAAIDEAAEVERLKYITGGAGQAMEYQQAAAEANALLAALDADPEHQLEEAAYPMLAASLGRDGATLAEVAETVAQMHQSWQAIGSAIRAARLSAKQAVDAAEDEASARAVQPVWPSG